MSSSEEKSLRRELGRRRVFLFVAVFLVLALAGVVQEESDMFLHALDEYAIIALSVVVIILIVLWRSKQSLVELKKQHNIIMAIFVVALVFKIYGLIVEANDPSDFGDEIPVFILLVLTIVNRFV